MGASVQADTTPRARERALKIVLAHKYFYRGGGTATYLFALMEHLRQLGHECIPFTIGYSQTRVDTYSDYFVSPPLGKDVTHFADMRLNPLSALKIFGRATYSLEARRKMSRLIEDTQPDLVFIHNIYNYMSPSILSACRQQRRPVMMRVADYNLVCPGLPLLRDDTVCTECVERGYWRALKHNCVKDSFPATMARVGSMYAHKWMHLYDTIDLFITPSEFMRQMLIRAGYDGEKIVHVPSFYPAQPKVPAQASEQDYILYFGRVSTCKGLRTLVRAFLALETEARLLIAGADVDGHADTLRELIQSLGGGRIEFVGMQQREQLDRLIAGSLFTVVPSRWHDNSPMSVLESFAHGKPVIGSRMGGIPEQITPECGLLFEAGNAEELTERMALLLGDAPLRKRLGEGAARRLREEFSPEKHCTRLLELFGRLLDN